MSLKTPDVLVIGGGPAGATLAARLARYGYRVTLRHREARKRHHVGESVPESLDSFLEELGITDWSSVCSARPTDHRVSWGSAATETIPYAEGRGRFLFRDAFDRLLLEHARASGARIETDSIPHRARLVADCSGRSGVHARRYRRLPGFRTLALTGYWRPSPEERSPPTVVESLPDGWVWSAPSRGGLRDVTVMVDAEAAGRDAYSKALGTSRELRRLLEGAALVGPPRGHGATPYTSRRFAGPDFIFVGDAGSFLDPLSSHGVHKAMDSALTAAVVVRTLLERPEKAEAAVQFYESRESHIVAITERRVAGFYARETRWADRPFWQKRSKEPSAQTPRGWGPGALKEKSVEAKLHVKSFLSSARLRPSPGVRAILAPVLESGWIETREVLVSPGEPRGVRFWNAVALPELFRVAVQSRSAEEAAGRSDIDPQAALSGIEWLYRAGFLENDR